MPTRLRSYFSVCLLFSLMAHAQTGKVRPPAPVLPLPTAAQLAWHKMETNAFVHFATNTFTGKEWGNGDEKEAVFNPTAVNTQQWASTLKETGFKTMILTCKHHDGFCLWPSKYTSHSIKNSPYKNGKGDIVREASDACKKYGLHFGVYLSPWDRNQASYGTPAYITYYRNQLKELFTQYGPIVEMWFDGANGGSGYYGGANETRKINGATYYDWPNTLKLVKSIQPNVIFFSDAGPDVRWVGNESGLAGETNWNCITADTLYAGKPNIEKLLNTGSPDGKQWIPAEVDVSIRPGWFYHANEDEKVKTPERLFEIYLTSVGRGSTLLLNIPPDQRGLFNEIDVQSLRGFRALLNKVFADNLAKNAKVSASSYRGKSSLYAPANLTDGKENTYWATDDAVTTGSVTIELPKPSVVQYITLQEYIQLGQRVAGFTIEAWKDNAWQPVASATTIGYKRIVKIAPVETGKLRINITSAKACPVISNIEIY
ncbi:MAG TPA: alpha-L-fucosidase [Chitinophagaceae bacterium]|nr:alpha-L-fucosidase [Chitinophagaceae bacterium]